MRVTPFQRWCGVVMVVLAAALCPRVSAQCNQWHIMISPWDYVYAITSFQGQLIASGALYGPGQVMPVGRWDGQRWQSMAAGLDDGAEAFTVYNGELHAIGHVLVNGQNVSRVVRWDGTQWQPLQSQPPSTSLGSLIIFEGDLIASGSGVWRWNGASWRQIGPTLNAAG